MNYKVYVWIRGHRVCCVSRRVLAQVIRHPAPADPSDVMGLYGQHYENLATRTTVNHLRKYRFITHNVMKEWKKLVLRSSNPDIYRNV
jgi:hypothetical protein